MFFQYWKNKNVMLVTNVFDCLHNNITMIVPYPNKVGIDVVWMLIFSIQWQMDLRFRYWKYKLVHITSLDN